MTAPLSLTRPALSAAAPLPSMMTSTIDAPPLASGPDISPARRLFYGEGCHCGEASWWLHDFQAASSSSSAEVAAIRGPYAPENILIAYTNGLVKPEVSQLCGTAPGVADKTAPPPLEVGVKRSISHKCEGPYPQTGNCSCMVVTSPLKDNSVLPTTLFKSLS